LREKKILEMKKKILYITFYIYATGIIPKSWLIGAFKPIYLSTYIRSNEL